MIDELCDVFFKLNGSGMLRGLVNGVFVNFYLWDLKFVIDWLYNVCCKCLS